MSDPKNEKAFNRWETGFSSCPDWALQEAWWYEFKRESPDARRLILNWRSSCSCKKPSFDEFFQLRRMMLMSPAPGYLYPLCPEWPEHPFSSIPKHELKRRLGLLFPNQIESLVRASQLLPITPARGELSPDVLNLLRELSGRGKEGEKVLWWIDWRKSNREILAFVNAFLKTHRPCKAQPNVSNRYLRADLKALEACRRLKANKDDYLGTLYQDQAKWTQARKRAERIIAKIDDFWA